MRLTGRDAVHRERGHGRLLLHNLSGYSRHLPGGRAPPGRAGLFSSSGCATYMGNKPPRENQAQVFKAMHAKGPCMQVGRRANLHWHPGISRPLFALVAFKITSGPLNPGWCRLKGPIRASVAHWQEVCRLLPIGC